MFIGFTVMAFIVPDLISEYAFPKSNPPTIFEIILLIAVIAIIFFRSITILHPGMVKRLRESEIQITDEYVERKMGGTLEKVFFRHIKHLVIIEDKSTEVISIKITAHKHSLNIGGFDEMNVMAENLQVRLGNSSIIQRKTQKIDWNNPMIFLPLVIIMGLILPSLLVTSIFKIGDPINNIIFSSFYLITGIIILVLKPISRGAGLYTKKNEILVGVVMIVGALLWGYATNILIWK